MKTLEAKKGKIKNQKWKYIKSIPNLEKVASIASSTKKHSENFYRRNVKPSPVIDFTAEYLATH